MPSSTKRVAASAGSKRVLLRVAHHEAGHAVASLFLMQRFRYVTIEPSEDAFGHVMHWPLPPTFRPDISVTPRGRSLIDSHVTILFAGGIAEKRFAGRHNYAGSKYDRNAAIDLAAHVCGPGKALEFYLKWRHQIAEDLISFRWVHVQKLARALVKKPRLTFAEANDVVFPRISIEGLDA